MTTAVAAFLLMAVAIWGSTEAFSDAAADCCLTISPHKIPKHLIVSYIEHVQNNGCHKAATVFITKKNKKLCSPPKEESRWVANLIKQLDAQAEEASKKTEK
ncbi:C-C motif chemokine 14-like [Astyanax mexicanus]|uniref:C-C motif chemokine 14-like n=2 Tax=Astyanax mexicanus TaxID=7994 RepID=A0A8B9JYD0_ASTMX|nr:C-C motif chemokine 14-like [Astyanax mexicanus]KAG9261978.1 C-C motif chemokine 14-like [Astyanax mexicanus]